MSSHPDVPILADVTMPDNTNGDTEGAEPRTTSLHAAILQDVETHILSGTWLPGHRIPAEQGLARHYGCSRMTVNKVMSQLAKAGMIERRRRAGSFVLLPRTESAVLAIQDVGAEVSALGLAYSFTVLKRRRRRSVPADRERLELAPNGPMLDLSCCHFAGKRPFCLERRLISLDAVPDAAREDFFAVAPGPWLVSRVPWSRAEHVIGASAADGETAALLRLPAGTACLWMERRTWSAGVPITWVRFVYPGDAHRIIGRFQPSTG